MGVGTAVCCKCCWICGSGRLGEEDARIGCSMAQFKVLTCFWDSLLVTSFFWLSKVPLTHAHLNQVPDLFPLSYQGSILENKTNRKPESLAQPCFFGTISLAVVCHHTSWLERALQWTSSVPQPANTRLHPPYAGLWHGIGARLVGSTSTLSTRDKGSKPRQHVLRHWSYLPRISLSDSDPSTKDVSTYL